MGKKLAVEDVSEQLKSRKLILNISKYVNTSTKCETRCDECNYVWDPFPRDYLYKKNGKYLGCPDCSGVRKLTQEEIDLFLFSKKMKLLEPYKNTMIKQHILCLNCNNDRFVKINDIRNGHECPFCEGGKRASLDARKKQYEKRGYTLLHEGNYKISNKYDTYCHKCKNIWLCKMGDIIYDNGGCPYCADQIPYTFEEIVEKLNSLGFQFIDNMYINTNAKHLVKCNECFFEWKTIVKSIFSGGGCPNCHSSSSQKIAFRTVKEILTNVFIEMNFPIKSDLSNRKYFFVDIVFNFEDKQYYIEYNGEQHYRPVTFGGISQDQAQKNFEKQVKRDEWVRNYCKANNIFLLEIDGRIYKKEKLVEFLSNWLIKYVLKS